MKRLLIVYHTHSGRTQGLAEAALAGARQIEDVDTELKRAFATGLDDLLGAHALLIGTPENFGSMSGAIKDLFERTYYPAEGLMNGRAYAVFVCAGNDGRGAHLQIDRIATGYGWRKVHDGLIVRDEPTAADLAAAGELGMTMAAGLSCGIY